MERDDLLAIRIKQACLTTHRCCLVYFRAEFEHINKSITKGGSDSETKAAASEEDQSYACVYEHIYGTNQRR